jgi:hypothetical protein
MERQFVYEVTAYPSEQFVRVGYFCTEQGECGLDQLPLEQVKAFEDILNQRGAQGWELVQALFGSDGVLTIWRRLEDAGQL